MTEYERYHGLVIRSLVLHLKYGVQIKVLDAHGIVNSFVLNNVVGLYIKHCSKRITPWIFSFTPDNLTELSLLRENTTSVFVALVCGPDGFLVLSLEDIQLLADKKQAANALTIHVARRKRQMYIVGGKNRLNKRKPRGFTEEIIHALEN